MRQGPFRRLRLALLLCSAFDPRTLTRQLNASSVNPTPPPNQPLPSLSRIVLISNGLKSNDTPSASTFISPPASSSKLASHAESTLACSLAVLRPRGPGRPPRRPARRRRPLATGLSAETTTFGIRDLQKAPALGQRAGVREHIAAEQRMIELPARRERRRPRASRPRGGPAHIASSAPGRAGSPTPTTFPARSRRRSRRRRGYGAEQRDHHRPVGHEVAGQADIEQGQAAAAVAVVHPVLGGELDRARAARSRRRGSRESFFPPWIVVGKRAW